jgi:hypothetical protein
VATLTPKVPMPIPTAEAAPSAYEYLFLDDALNDDVGLEAEFQKQSRGWHNDTRVMSSIQKKIFNEHYQRIIGMGKPALPLIFRELKERGGYWYWALECITGLNPAASATNIEEAKRAWLEFATSANYINVDQGRN